MGCRLARFMKLATIRLKKQEQRRLQAGHLWIYSNEIATSLKDFQAGDEVSIEAYDQTPLGSALINPHSLITARLYSLKINTPFSRDLVIQAIQQALALRQAYFPEPYYRLIYGDSDFLPGLIVDRFGKHLVMQCNTAGIDQKKELIK